MNSSEIIMRQLIPYRTPGAYKDIPVVSKMGLILPSSQKTDVHWFLANKTLKVRRIHVARMARA